MHKKIFKLPENFFLNYQNFFFYLKKKNRLSFKFLFLNIQEKSKNYLPTNEKISKVKIMY